MEDTSIASRKIPPGTKLTVEFTCRCQYVVNSEISEKALEALQEDLDDNCGADFDEIERTFKAHFPNGEVTYDQVSGEYSGPRVFVEAEE
jgi:hypothetical protein